MLHVHGVFFDLAGMMFAACLPAVDLFDAIRRMSHIDGHRVARDIARIAIVLAAKSILRIIRAVNARDRQRIARRRVTVVGNAAIKLAALRLSGAVKGDPAAFETVDHPDDGSRLILVLIRHQCALMRIRRPEIPHGIVLEMQRVRRRALQQLDAAHAVDILEIVCIDRRAVDADLAPIDARAREISRVLDGQHHVVIRKRLIQLEIVAFKVVDGLYGDILPVDAERIARHIRLVAAIDRVRRERRTSEIGMLRVAKADRVARRLSCAIGIAAVNVGGSAGILEASARDGDAVVRDIARADSIAAVNRAFDLAACDGDAVVHDIPCAGSHARTAECTASVDSSRSDLTA